MHASGRLVFRAKVPPACSPDLPFLAATDQAVAWEEVVPSDYAGPIEIEIGCGKGTFLLEAATARPGVQFVGVEAAPAYARYAADRAARSRLANIVFVADDARLFLRETTPEGAAARIHVYFPDPWPKRRHRKRRLFDPETVSLLARALAPGGELLVATDDTRYFGEMLAVLGASPRFHRSRAGEIGYGEETPGVAFGPTNFGRKYREEGRARHRAVYVKARGRATGTHRTEERWIRVARLDQVPSDTGLGIECEGRELALFRLGDRVVCLEDSCPHRGAALSEGTVQSGEVQCPWHGWCYALADGACSTLPGSMPAKTYAVRVAGSEVFVRL